jgi:CBS domain-containing protein
MQMEEPRDSLSLTRRTTVRECDQLSVIAPNRIPPDYTLIEIIKSVERAPRVLTLAVVDAGGRLLGVIPFTQIVDEVFWQVSPEEFLSDVHNLDDAHEYAMKSRLSRAATAGEMMRPPVYVREDELVVDAFRKMREADLRGLPIVDADMVVIGYIDMLELVLVWLRAEQRKGNG